MPDVDPAWAASGSDHLGSAEAAELVGVTAARIRQIAYAKIGEGPHPKVVYKSRRKPPEVWLAGTNHGRAWQFTPDDVAECVRVREFYGVRKGSEDFRAHRGNGPEKSSNAHEHGRLRSIAERLRWVESRLDSIEAWIQTGGSRGATAQGHASPSSTAGVRAGQARGRAVNLLIDALKEMQAVDDAQLDEIQGLHAALNNPRRSGESDGLAGT